LPIPCEDEAGAALYDEIGSMTRALSRRDDSAVEARLNALVATLYQLTPEEFRHVLSTFPLIPEKERSDAMTEFARL
jgi:hypothetical protein